MIKKKSLASKVLPKSVLDAMDRTIEPHLRKRASGTGVCSEKTAQERRLHIRASIAQLWVSGYKITKLESIGSKHIKALMTFWGNEGRSAEFLHNRLSALRTLVGWMGKRNVVGDMDDYLAEDRTQRRTATEKDRSWTAKKLDPLAVIKFAATFDERMAVMLALQHHFGLRVKESIEIRPANALVADGSAIEIYEGTKGGLLRRYPIATAGQRDAIDRARQLAAGSRSKRVRWPDLTWKQAQRRFYYYMDKRLGLTKDQWGVTAHGLRHDYEHRRYEEESGHPTPIKVATAGRAVDIADSVASVRPIPPAGLTWEKHHLASITVSHELGHGRVDVTTAYGGTYGHALRSRKQADAEKIAEEEEENEKITADAVE